ncbi:hypothetical protein GCM10017655_44760 [Pseudomonas turukhanskensis]|uniref:Uncharacterized protein n=1 Tax=Pseudomonas turukhanskensis TaxID=1806536 RepID=A0A9W6K9V3_9PSED|nr:hypothetical protein GCM10017655_44760 [Pseudomonas turukhanskensis]
MQHDGQDQQSANQPLDLLACAHVPDGEKRSEQQVGQTEEGEVNGIGLLQVRKTLGVKAGDK